MRSKHLDDRLIPCFIVAFQLAQFRHVRHQKIRITLRQVLAPFSLHRQRQFQQLGLKMVERELLIVKRPSVGKGIVGIKQRDAQRAGDREDPRQTNLRPTPPACLHPARFLPLAWWAQFLR